MKDYIDNEHNFDKGTMLGIIFLIASISGIIGFGYELVFYFFNGGMKDWYYPGGNFLPWINIYAYGALLIYFFTYKNRKKPLVVFIKSLIITGLLEFISGWAIYTFFDGLRLWDYNVEIWNFGNIGGFICFRSVFFFGISGLLLIYFVIPFCFMLARKLNKKTFLIITISLLSLILIDDIYNLIIARIFSLPRAYDVYSSIGFHYVDFGG